MIPCATSGHAILFGGVDGGAVCVCGVCCCIIPAAVTPYDGTQVRAFAFPRGSWRAGECDEEFEVPGASRWWKRV